MRFTDGQGKVALVTGSSSGLGRAVASRLSARGFRVIGLGRKRPADTAETEFIECDLAAQGAAERAFAELAKRTERLDILVNNAGFGGYATWEELPEAELRRMVEVDFFAPVLLAQKCLPLLRQTHGAIVNLASIAGIVPVPCMGAYSAVKAALLAFSVTLRAEAAQSGVRVLTVCPGRISTGFSQRAVRLRECPDTPGNHVNPERFAEAVIAKLERNRRLLIYPAWYKLFAAFYRCFPELYARLAVKVWKL